MLRRRRRSGNGRIHDPPMAVPMADDCDEAAVIGQHTLWAVQTTIHHMRLR